MLAPFARARGRFVDNTDQLIDRQQLTVWRRRLPRYIPPKNNIPRAPPGLSTVSRLPPKQNSALVFISNTRRARARGLVPSTIVQRCVGIIFDHTRTRLLL